MKTKQTLITTGQYDSYRVVAMVRGPDRPAISTLRKRFEDQFCGPPPAIRAQHPSAPELEARVVWRSDGEARCRSLGMGNDLAEAFAIWLRLEHGYTWTVLAEENF